MSMLLLVVKDRFGILKCAIPLRPLSIIFLLLVQFKPIEFVTQDSSISQLSPYFLLYREYIMSGNDDERIQGIKNKWDERTKSSKYILSDSW